MNKLLILFLVVCLVSVHAFVKRDAPEAAKDNNVAEDIKNQLEKIAKEAGEKLKDAFDSENLKKQFNDLVDNVNKGIENLKPKST